MLLSDLLVQSAEQFQEKTAVIVGEHGITFGELHRQSSQLAARLRRLGVGPGARVALLHQNALEAVIFFWGVLKSGAQLVDLPSLAGVGTISGILSESKPAVLIASERQLQRLATREDCLPRNVITGTVPAGKGGGTDYHSLAEITQTEPGSMCGPVSTSRMSP